MVVPFFLLTFVAMKRVALTILFAIGVLTATEVAGASLDTLILRRVFSYQKRYIGEGIEGFQSNVYVKHLYQTQKRNAALWAIPSMYAIAKGERQFVSEQYSRFTFRDGGGYENRRQVYYTTIPHHRRTMPVLLELLTPNLYDATLYGDHILSPFNRSNHVFYRYRLADLSGGRARLYFRPRFVNNTQLITGQALVEIATGRIIEVEFQGEFDMIRFQTRAMQGRQGPRSLLPRLNQTDIDFRFMGNHITSHFEAVFDCPITLPDSVDTKGNRQLIDSVRPISLSDEEQAVYAYYDSLHQKRPDVVEQKADTLLSDSDSPTPHHRHDYLKEIGWDLIGENLIRSLRAQSDVGYVKLSPIINPQYISYSHSKGFSYKLKLGARYNFNEQTALGFNPTVGYNFKLRKFYFRLPFQLDFDPEHDGHADIVWANGNRIGNSTVVDQIRQDMQLPDDAPLADADRLDLFDDLNLHVTANYRPLSWMAVETGLVFHKRRAVDQTAMRQYGRPTEYRSLAPMVSLKLRPWRRAPLFTIDYERGLKGQNNNLTYERWEADASVKHRMSRMQTLNLRFGGGVYTRKDNNYFMDFANFRDENLPEGWDDDWTGNFQLLSSRDYNRSKYYVRGNVSYESPLLLVSLVPLVGRYVERERAYASSLLIGHSRPYTELGYGFTCRYFSMGLFASFRSMQHQELGAKFTFELFRRW